jgi:phage terminase large subunit-like protein
LALPTEAKSKRPAQRKAKSKTLSHSSSKHPHVKIAHDYAVSVVAGIVPACSYVQAACKRHLDDLEKTDWAFEFDPVKAERICDFSKLFVHIKGPLAGQHITLEPWQCFILCCVFGWVWKATGKRRFRRVYIEVPRGNGKTTVSVVPALYCLCAEKEGGAEIYSAARVKDQAKIAFTLAQQMLRKNPAFGAHLGVDVLAHRIIHQGSASFFEAVASDADSLDGKNVHFGLIDELHAHRTREVYDAIETGAGKRDQAILWAITTAGSDKTGICYEQRAYALNILRGTVQDDSYFGIVYTIDEGDDWTDEATWKKANPNFGVSVEAQNLASMCAKAMQSPASQAAFLTKHLNVWVQTDQALYDTRAWDRCANDALNIEDFRNKTCRIAVDLATKTDLAVVSLLFEGDEKLAAFSRFYVPEAAIAESRHGSYAGWQIEGHLIETPGDVVDFDTIERDIRDDLEKYDVAEIGFDPWQSAQMSTSLLNSGAPCVEFRQVTSNFSEPTKELDSLMRTGGIEHDGNPVMAWCIGNVVGHYDAKENVYPRKERPENRIDGAVALIMALGLRMKGEQNSGSYLKTDELMIL